MHTHKHLHALLVMFLYRTLSDLTHASMMIFLTLEHVGLVCVPFLRNPVPNRVWWCTSIILELWEAKAERLEVQAWLGQLSETLS